MHAVKEDSDCWTKSRVNGQAGPALQGSRVDAPDRRCDLAVRRSRHAVRHHRQSLAHVQDTARINASNPCSEYMFLDDSACNLASLNLMKFVGPDGQFDVEAFRHAVDTVITAQEIIVDNASYPTEMIAKNSHEYRPLGLGFANLGALLMSMGVPYDSDQGRDFSGAITAVMCGQSYLTSARIAEATGPFPGYLRNEHSFLDVIRMHRDCCQQHRQPTGSARRCSKPRWRRWNQAYEKGKVSGFRNAQTTVIAPTGTIGFMMDCDTTGIEPDLALVKYKKLVGGGVIKIVNHTVPQALIKLGYTPEQVEQIVATSTRPAPSKALRISRTNIWPSSIAASVRRTAPLHPLTWAT